MVTYSMDRLVAFGQVWIGLKKRLAKATHYPPFYPILVGIASRFIKDFELAGRVVSMVMGSLVVIPVYLLGKEFYNRRTGLFAAVLTLSWWSIRNWSGEVMSQATYITLLLFGVYLLWITTKRCSLLAAVGGGVFMSLAHLTRSEGIIVFFAITTVLLIGVVSGKVPKGNLQYILVSWLSFWIVFSPYFFLLHKLTGAWQLTGKSRIAIADGLSIFLNRPDLKMDPSYATMGYLDLFSQFPDYLRHNISVNTEKCWNEMLPLFLWILSFVGFVTGGWDESSTLKRGYLLATFVPMVPIILFFFIGPEYTQPYLPVLFLWVGQGVVWLGQKTCLLAGKDDERKAKFTVVIEVATLAAVLFYSASLLAGQIPADRNMPYSYKNDDGRYDEKQVGIRLRSLVPEGAVIMTRSGRTGFYSQRPYVMPPQAELVEIINYARENNVNYLVVTKQLINRRPQMAILYAPLLDPEKKTLPPPGFELIYVGQEPGGVPYLVYRIK